MEEWTNRLNTARRTLHQIMHAGECTVTLITCDELYEDIKNNRHPCALFDNADCWDPATCRKGTCVHASRPAHCFWLHGDPDCDHPDICMCPTTTTVTSTTSSTTSTTCPNDCFSESCAACGPQRNLGDTLPPGTGDPILHTQDDCNLCCTNPVDICHQCCFYRLTLGDLYCCPETPGTCRGQMCMQ